MIDYHSLREFAVASSGTYYVSAAGYGSNTGTYRVTVEDLGGSGGRADDYGMTPGSSGSVAVDGTATGAIEVAHDEDWFAVDLEAGETYTIGVQGSATGGGTLSDPYLFGIYDASGSLLDGTTDDDSGTWLNSEVEFTAASSGRHFISAGAYWSDTGTYTVSVDRAVAVSDDFAGNTGTAGRIVPGGDGPGRSGQPVFNFCFVGSGAAGEQVALGEDDQERHPRLPEPAHPAKIGRLNTGLTVDEVKDQIGPFGQDERFGLIAALAIGIVPRGPVKLYLFDGIELPVGVER